MKDKKLKKNSIDWRLLGGFGALLFFIVVIGVIGIIQIQSLSRTVDDLGEKYFPAQKAILEMKSSNGLYATGIRNYIFWRSSKYLEAASTAANLKLVNTAVKDFDKNLSVYSSHVISREQKQWVERVSASQEELRLKGGRIIGLVDEADKITDRSKKKSLESTIDKLVMAFENNIYRINDFLEQNLEKDNLAAIKQQLETSNLTKVKAISFLGISLVIVFLIGSQTAGLIYRDRRRERERREQLVQKMIKIEEEERRNLSLEIHDQMGQELSGLKIYLDLINQELPSGKEGLKIKIAECKKILSGLMEKGHNISEFLRPPALEEVGLIDTIGALIVQYEQRTKIEFIYEKPDVDVKLSGEHSLFLYRVIQEGLTNIVKYSQAKKVSIDLLVLKTGYQLTIQDNGIGFDYTKFMKERAGHGNLGLMGLEERAELLGGSITVDTAPGKGTKLIAQLPK